MTKFALDHVKLATNQFRADVLGYLLLPSNRKQSVAVDTGNQRANSDALQSLLDTTSVATNVV